VAAGSERLGFLIAGPPCFNAPRQWSDNFAHSSLVGVLLKANTLGANCTWLNRFTMNLNWDFGVVTMQVRRSPVLPVATAAAAAALAICIHPDRSTSTHAEQATHSGQDPPPPAPPFPDPHPPCLCAFVQGIPTDVLLTGVVAADNKHAGISILRKSGMTEPGQVGLNGGLLIGQSDPYVCALCVDRRDGGAMDPGCAPKMVARGNNKNSPFTPSRGLVTSVFGTSFVPGELAGAGWRPDACRRSTSLPCRCNACWCAPRPAWEHHRICVRVCCRGTGGILRRGGVCAGQCLLRHPSPTHSPTPPLPPTGPEHYPWDHTHGFQSVLGVMLVSGVTLASFGGGSAAAGSCLGGTYALANHLFAPDASHPHFLRSINLQSTSSRGLFLMTEPAPGWRNEADCGTAELQRSDGSTLPLNCAGERRRLHMRWHLVGRIAPVARRQRQRDGGAAG
jgi:hypothetical protein